jgi:hypothetical protein
MPLPLLKQVERKMREFADQRTSLVEAFVAIYPELCQHAPGQLRALHNLLLFGMEAALHYLFAKVNLAKADAFIDRLNDGDGLRRDSPINSLRARFI